MGSRRRLDLGPRFLILLFLFFVLVGLIHGQESRPKEAEERGLRRRVLRVLKSVNKPAAKTIESPDGDIVDCVHAHQQPAFDHPLLRNAKIKKMPAPKATSRPASESSESGHGMQQLWQKNGECPDGTVPIRRTTVKDVLRAGLSKQFGRKHRVPPPMTSSSSASPESGGGIRHEHSIGYLQGGQYYGAEATINVWDPSVQVSSEFSLSQIWLLAGSYNGGDLNSIEAGWQVSPNLYGDSNPRFFTYWTNDAYQRTGCYNLLCSGFVQTSGNILMGGSISPTSSVNSSQYDIHLLIWKDLLAGDWWLQYGNKLIGYWPSELFSNLGSYATTIEWGGEVVNSEPNSRHTSTQMGSGNYAEAGFSRASYFRNLAYVNAFNALLPASNLQTFSTRSSCYDIHSFSSRSWGVYFYYGGPGLGASCI